jgi:GYF domain 2
MADTWYYARDDKRNGPFSGRQLRDLADAGNILGTDTVYKTGVEQGMLATKVKHLFPPVEPPPPTIAKILPAELPPVPAVELAAIDPPLVALVEPTPPEPVASSPESHTSKPFQEPPPRKKTASAGKGAIMMGQDGTNVRFKKQCTTCQHVDSSSISMKITQGTMRAGFFCPKCRKRREVELQGH